jgi:hypothetical protein
MSSEPGKEKFGVLERLAALLGDDLFFVCCEWATKKPLVTYVERPFQPVPLGPNGRHGSILPDFCLSACGKR